jgi:beta-carotene isomerase
MDAKMIAHNISLTPTLSQWRSLRLKPKHTFVVGVLARPSDNIAEETLKKTNVYNDNWFDKLAINHLSKSVQAATGNLLISSFLSYQVDFVIFFVYDQF